MTKPLSSGCDATETSRGTSIIHPSYSETIPRMRAIATRRAVQDVELETTAAEPERYLGTSETPVTTLADPRCDPANCCIGGIEPGCALPTVDPSHQVLTSVSRDTSNPCVHGEVCIPRLNDTHVLSTPFCHANTVDSTLNNLQNAGLLNVNSLDAEKFTACANFVKYHKLSWLALTELVKPCKDATSLDRYLNSHDTFPILSDATCQRVGLMVPKFLKAKFSILEAKYILQRRDRNCQKVC